MTIETTETSETREVDFTFIDRVIEEKGRDPSAVIPILQAIQQQYRWLPEEALRRVCDRSDITPSAITGVSSFYSQFRHQPVGRHMVSVCRGTACHVKGADGIVEALKRHLKLSSRQDTDSRKLFTVQTVACLGCCTLAPAVQIDDVTYGHLTPEMVPGVLNDFLELQKRGKGKPAGATRRRIEEMGGEIRIGLGSCCVSRGSGRLHEALEAALAKTGVRIKVKRVGCVGMCHQTPLLEVIQPGGDSSLYALVKPEDAEAIVLRHFKPRGWIARTLNRLSGALDSLLVNGAKTPVTRYAIDVRDPPVSAFLDKQKHLATEHCGRIDPLDLDEYMRGGGFQALEQCVGEGDPERVIEIIRASGLRGRGGAGYPSGLKWSQVRHAVGGSRTIICNGDEGDPGAFMDRMLLESFPYRIIEGMAIAAFAVGARNGYFYIRAEYPLAVQRIREALVRCENKGLLGENLFDKGFDLQLEIREGAGAFVCGEETALIASMEGRRGMPRYRPPYPAESGFQGMPTLVNNTETFALVPHIVKHGPGTFNELGTQESTGTKVFALAGKVVRGGLIEVPMGITLKEVIEDIGGGPEGGRRLKAIQIGGPSGGCVPADLLDVTVDYEALTRAGAIMGSGGLVVLDEGDCMVDVARYFLEFTQNQSCGRCTFCRIGTRRMLDILDRLCEGQGKKGDLEALESLAHSVKKGSLCGLGGTAPNPVLSTLRYFRDEYEAHLDGRCPAGKCRTLITYSVTDACIGCTRCAQHCPVGAITMRHFEKHEINTERCIRCGTCKSVCPSDAVRVE